MTKDLNKHSSKEDIQIANKNVKGCSISLFIWEMLIITTKRYHFTPRMAIIKIQVITNAGEDVE